MRHNIKARLRLLSIINSQLHYRAVNTYASFSSLKWDSDEKVELSIQITLARLFLSGNDIGRRCLFKFLLE